MKNTYKKYLISLCILLVLGTVIVISIGQLKRFKIRQPEGSYMQAKEAQGLFRYLSEYITEPAASDLKETQPGEQLLTYESLKLYFKQLADANLIDATWGEKLEKRYENKYLLKHYILEEDFLTVYCELAELICPEEQIELGKLSLLEGGAYVSRLESGETLQAKELLSSDGTLYQAALVSKEKEDILLKPLFQEVQCLHTGHEILYLEEKEFERLKQEETAGQKVELSRCFVADSETNPVVADQTFSGNYIKAYWGLYSLWILNETEYNRREDVTDLVFSEGSLSEVQIYQDKVNGKILSLTEQYVELELDGMGSVQYPFSEDMKAYKLFGDTQKHDLQCSLSELAIGYDFTDFVLDESKEVVAALVTREAEMSNIRVLLKNSDFASVYHEKVKFFCDTDYVVTSQTETKSMTANTELEIDAESELFQNDRIRITPVAKTARIVIPSINRSQGIPAYRGTLEIERTKEGLIVVNELLLEEYLYSVVPSEMPSSYPLEAQKAQAISARTYAYQHMEKSSLQKYGAHVDDSTSYQVYNNIEESSKATQAVRESAGVIATINGQTAGTYFYSTSCGFGTTPEVWHSNGTEDTSHLQAKEIAPEEVISPESVMEEETFATFLQSGNTSDFEKEEGWYRWKYETQLDEERLFENLQSRYEAYPQQIVTKDEKENYTSLPITEIGHITDIYVAKRLPGGVIDELIIVGENSTIKVISERNVRFVLANEQTKVQRQTGDESTVSTMLPSAFAVIALQKEDDEVTGYTVTGGGYGHGIGMSQNGAKDMAEMGYDYEQILQFFYEGIALHKLVADSQEFE